MSVPFRCQLASEALKLRTVRTTAALGLAAVALEVLFKIVSAVLVDPRTAREGEVLFALKPSITYAATLSLIGALCASSEWAYGVAASTYATQPDRRRVLLAKASVSGLGGLVVGFVATALSLGASAAVLQARAVPVPDGSAVTAVAVGSIVIGAVFAALGAAVGSMASGQTAAIGVVVVALFVVPPLAILVSPAFYALTPSGAADGIVAQQSANPALLPIGASALLLSTYGLLLIALAARAVESRDIGS